MLIYKYLPPARVDVLAEGLLRCTPPADLNDVFELRPPINSVFSAAKAQEAVDKYWPQVIANADSGPAWVARLIPKPVTRLLFRRVPALYAMRHQLLRELKSAMNSSLLEETRASVNDGFDPVRARVGVVSFSSNAGSPAMWAHYAQDHEGYVVGYDGEHEVFRSPPPGGEFLCKLGPVRYVHNGVDAFEALGPDLFFLKSDVWKYEEELRLVVGLEGGLARRELPTGKELQFLQVPPDAVREVIIGARAAKDLVGDIRSVLQAPDYRHISLLQGRNSVATYQVETMVIDAT